MYTEEGQCSAVGDGYINNTDVGWNGVEGLHGFFYPPNWGSLCGRWGQTVSSSLFWLAVHTLGLH